MKAGDHSPPSHVVGVGASSGGLEMIREMMNCFDPLNHKGVRSIGKAEKNFKITSVYGAIQGITESVQTRGCTGGWPDQI